jgi:hypothetical protein
MYVPGAQSVQTELPAAATFPAEQAVHAAAAVAPVLPKYLPATHAWRGHAAGFRVQQHLKGNRRHWAHH